jgi:hypothetical protein
MGFTVVGVRQQGTGCSAPGSLPSIAGPKHHAGVDQQLGPTTHSSGCIAQLPHSHAAWPLHHAGAPAGKDDSEEWEGSPARRRPAGGSSHSRGSSSDSGSGSEKPADGNGSVQQLAAGSKRAVSYMPFSEGPRNCVGQSLAKMEVLVVLAKLLAAFRWVLHEWMQHWPALSLHVMCSPSDS